MSKKKQRTAHWEVCEAPICQDERGYYDPDWKKNVIWYPGEPVCQKTPLTLWQKRQKLTNRWLANGEFKYKDEYYFTVEMLMRGKHLKKGRRGGNPNLPLK